MLIHTLLSAAVGGLLKKLRVLQDHRGSHEMMQRECRCKNVKKKNKKNVRGTLTTDRDRSRFGLLDFFFFLSDLITQRTQHLPPHMYTY